MKKIFIIFVLAVICSAFAADYASIIAEAKAAAGKKDHAAALLKFDEAVNTAATSAQKLEAYTGKFLTLNAMNKAAEAKELINNALEDESLNELDARRLANNVGQAYIWTVHCEFGLSILKAVKDLPCPYYSNEYFSTMNLIAMTYLSRKKDYPTAITIMEEYLAVKNIHPGNAAAAWSNIGLAYERMNKKAEALAAYKTSLEFMNKVTYKVDKSSREKKIRELEAELKSGK